jgi:hypothetical protein
MVGVLAFTKWWVSWLSLRETFSPGKLIGEPWTTGRTALWAAFLLAVYLILNYLE